MKCQTLLAVLFFCFTASASQFSGEEPLEVALFYESYCPGCIQFVEEQLINVYKVFVEHVQLKLLPYGNTEQRFLNGHWEFDCQHGARECLANKLHACAIYQACGESGTVSCAADKLSQVLSYISCVMKHRDQLQATSQCAQASHLEADNIFTCAKGGKGNQLLNLYGNLTEELAPWKAYTPTVAVNGEHDEEAEHNLMDRLCQLKPFVCNNTRTTPGPDFFAI